MIGIENKTMSDDIKQIMDEVIAELRLIIKQEIALQLKNITLPANSDSDHKLHMLAKHVFELMAASGMRVTQKMYELKE